MIDKQGVAYADPDGDMVTTIVGGRDCAFRGCHGCLLSSKPISCDLYPIRVKEFGGGLVGINYHRWDICKDAIIKGKEMDMPCTSSSALPSSAASARNGTTNSARWWRNSKSRDFCSKTPIPYI